jgi:Protein of unknown function (DUF3105)
MNKSGVPASRGAQARRSSQPKPIWPWIVAAAAGVILVAMLGIFLANLSPASAGPGQYFPAQSRDHIAVGAPHPAYNSDPPTGGWHYDTPWKPGFYEQPVADEYLVHNLEHGYVVISYDCSKLADCEGTKTQIRGLMQRYNNWKLVAAPRKNADAAVALTAWGWLEKLDGYDDAKMTAFIDAWRDHGPEKTAE